ANALKIAEPVAAALAKFSGIVVDSLDAPLSGAEVTIPSAEKGAITDSKGAYAIVGVPVGDQSVAVRRVGDAPLEVKVQFGPGGTVERKLVMHRAVTLDSVLVKAKQIDRFMQDFEDNRRLGLGHFLTRADLEKRNFATLGDVIREVPGVAVRSGVANR